MNHAAQTIHLGAGETHSLRVEPGVQLVAVHGTVAVSTAPRWLADTVWRGQVVIRPGQAHAVDVGGWVTLATVVAEAELRCMPASPRPDTPHFASALFALARRTFA